MGNLFAKQLGSGTQHWVKCFYSVSLEFTVCNLGVKEVVLDLGGFRVQGFGLAFRLEAHLRFSQLVGTGRGSGVSLTFKS